MVRLKFNGVKRLPSPRIQRKLTIKSLRQTSRGKRIQNREEKLVRKDRGSESMVVLNNVKALNSSRGLKCERNTQSKSTINLQRLKDGKKRIQNRREKQDSKAKGKQTISLLNGINTSNPSRDLRPERNTRSKSAVKSESQKDREKRIQDRREKQARKDKAKQRIALLNVVKTPNSSRDLKSERNTPSKSGIKSQSQRDKEKTIQDRHRNQATKDKDEQSISLLNGVKASNTSRDLRPDRNTRAKSAVKSQSQKDREKRIQDRREKQTRNDNARQKMALLNRIKAPKSAQSLRSERNTLSKSKAETERLRDREKRIQERRENWARKENDKQNIGLLGSVKTLNLSQDLKSDRNTRSKSAIKSQSQKDREKRIQDRQEKQARKEKQSITPLDSRKTPNSSNLTFRRNTPLRSTVESQRLKDREKRIQERRENQARKDDDKQSIELLDGAKTPNPSRDLNSQQNSMSKSTVESQRLQDREKRIQNRGEKEARKDEERGSMGLMNGVKTPNPSPCLKSQGNKRSKFQLRIKLKSTGKLQGPCDSIKRMQEKEKLTPDVEKKVENAREKVRQATKNNYILRAKTNPMDKIRDAYFKAVLEDDKIQPTSDKSARIQSRDPSVEVTLMPRPRKKHQISNWSLKCKKCKRHFVTETLLEKHISLKHPELRSGETKNVRSNKSENITNKPKPDQLTSTSKNDRKISLVKNVGHSTVGCSEDHTYCKVHGVLSFGATKTVQSHNRQNKKNRQTAKIRSSTSKNKQTPELQSSASKKLSDISENFRKANFMKNDRCSTIRCSKDHNYFKVHEVLKSEAMRPVQSHIQQNNRSNLTAIQMPSASKYFNVSGENERLTVSQTGLTSNIQKLRCPICDRNFINTALLNQHVNRTHLQARPETFVESGIVSPSSASVPAKNSVVLRVSSPLGVPVQITSPSQVTATENIRKVEPSPSIPLKVNHPQCPICNKYYVNNELLAIHVTRQHLQLQTWANSGKL